MGEYYNKPYEISIWEDRLISEDNKPKYFKEFKIATLGSNTMTSPQRAVNPVLTENVNGEKTLTFSLAYKYFDPLNGEIVINPLYKYLVNERKIKLFYNNKWYDFVIKTREESGDENIYNYTAKELFSLELSKVGYNITLDQSLGNNQGTITELAEKVLEGTDWQLDKENTDLLQQLVQDPIYNGVLETEIEVLNLDTNEKESLSQGQEIYFFYSYVANKTQENVQFMCVSATGQEQIDDHYVITSTNYRLLNKVSFEEADGIIKVVDATNQTELITLNELNYTYQGYRLAYGPLTTFDAVANRTVDIYKAEYNDRAQTIYHYLDYSYATSEVVRSFLTNGSNFNTFENGTVQGWKSRTELSRTNGEIPVVQPLSFVHYPPIHNSLDLRAIDMISTIEGYLQLKFHDVLGPNYENTYYNSGFEDAASAINHITAGEEFVLRTRFKIGDEKLTELKPGKGGIRAIVALYTEETDENKQFPYYLSEESKAKGLKSYLTVYKINPENIILNFDGDFQLSENVIQNGSFDSTFTKYIVDDVVQTPSTLYCYKDKNNLDNVYVWNCTEKKYVLKDDKYTDYYLTTTKARVSCTNKMMSDPLTRIGVFLYVDDPSLVGEDKYIYLQDVQLTRCYRNNGEITLQGNVPQSGAVAKDQFYLQPLKGMTFDEVNLYESLEDLARVLGIPSSVISQVYNENSEKILSIQAEHSNIFDILQSLCETFECWLHIDVKHDSNGAIALDKNNNPIKRISFKKYAGKDNYAGFRYGVNLESISRTFESDELVTKLIVEPVQSEYVDSGLVDIQYAPSNTSGQSYILNFSYYQNQNLIDTVEVNKDVNEFNTKVKEINNELHQLTSERDSLALALTRLRSKYTVIESLIDEARDKYEEGKADFEKVTKIPYDEFVSTYNTLEEYVEEQTEEAKKNNDREFSIATNDTIVDIIGQIYLSASVVNNYVGILTNLKEEYRLLELKYKGAKEYGISININPQSIEVGKPIITTVAIDDYLNGLSFTLSNEEEALEYNTDINNRIFELYSGIPYNLFTITAIPEHYSLEVFTNNQSYIISRESVQNSSFRIYNPDTNSSILRRFKLIPDKEWKAQYPGYDDKEEQLIDEKKQLETEFNNKYSRYIQEGTWTSQDYIDPELYYLDALQVSNTSAQPKASYTIQVTEISELPEYNNYYFEIGDKTYIEDTEIFGYTYTTFNDSIVVKDGSTQSESLYIRTPVREEVIVSQTEWHLDSPEENVITIQNYKTRFEDLFQRISAAVQTVEYNEATYAKISSILDSNGLIKPELLSNSMLGAAGDGFALTSNGSIRTDGSGLIIQDLTNGGNYVKIINSGIQISSDGGKTWSTALNAQGISTDNLTAGTINTQNIWLMDGDNPSFRWDKAGLNAYGLDENGQEAYNLRTYVRFDKYGLYGVKNGENFIASSLQNIKDTAFFGVTWDGFFIKNSYKDGGYVSISSDNDFQVVQGNQERIKIGALEFDDTGAPTKYGMNIKNADGEPVFTTGSDGNVTMTGTINATNGIFSGIVDIGPQDQNHVVIDGEMATIRSSNYAEGASGLGWAINGDGDATFSNVSVRGSIKTAVFEYEEIQAVGGAFLFRPSSSIKSARFEPSEITVISESGEEETIQTYYHYGENGEIVYNDLYVTVEKPLVFRENNWVKISNYANEQAPAPTDAAGMIGNGGLSHIYKIKSINVNTNSSDSSDYVVEDGDYVPTDSDTTEETLEYTNEICLEGAGAILEITTLDDLAGGSLLDFGSHKQDEEGLDIPGDHNYGIGINSSDNYVNLPPRTISLFETTIHPDKSIKVTYNYRGILGTLPKLSNDLVSPLYTRYMEGQQGIFTNNMYIGDKNQYMAFYTDEQGRTQLRVVAKKFEVLPDDGDLIDLGNSIVDQKIQYNVSISTEYNSLEEDWALTPYEVGENEYLWQRTYVKYANGTIDYLPSEEGYYVSSEAGQPGPQGPAGEDAVVLTIDSSNGNTFKNSGVDTKLTVTIYKGTTIITDLTQLQQAFGNTAYLQWYWKRRGDSTFKELLSTDSMLSNDGFTLTLTPDKVDVKVVFQCEIKTVDE